MPYEKNYLEAALRKGQQYFDYMNTEDLELNDQLFEQYEIVEKISQGKYSQVFKAVSTKLQRSSFFAIKVLKPIRLAKIKREIKILKDLQKFVKCQNIIKYVSSAQQKLLGNYCICTQYHQNSNFYDQLHNQSPQTIKNIMFYILLALDKAHSIGIMHRDIKPSNIILSKLFGQIKPILIDWGLAQYYLPTKQYSVKVASLNYKAPQLLMGYQMYDFSIDMWSFGVILASLIFHKKKAFIKGHTNIDQFCKTLEFCGTASFEKFIYKYNIKLETDYDQVLHQKVRPKVKIQQLVDQNNSHLATSEALDLLSKILVVDPKQRLTAKQALQHPYFNNVSKKLKIKE